MRFFGLFTLMLLCLGCAGVATNLQMNRNTTIDIVDTTDDVINTSGVDQATIRAINKRIMKNTSSYLFEYGIKSNHKEHPENNATLEISVDAIEVSRDLIGQLTYKIKYSYKLVNKGKIILKDKNDKETNSVGDVCDSISEKIAKKVRKYFIAEG